MSSLTNGDRGEDRCLDVKTYSIKNCEGSEILPYLQANKLACYSFMAAESETKNLFTHDIAVTLNIMFALALLVLKSHEY